MTDSPPPPCDSLPPAHTRRPVSAPAAGLRWPPTDGRLRHGATLKFFWGPMDCGKSTLALQMNHNHARQGRRGLVLTRIDRSLGPQITTRIGLAHDAIEVTDDLDLRGLVRGRWADGVRVDYLICDEACFYTVEHVEQMAELVDCYDVDVFAFGLATDFRSYLFPAAQRLFELADEVTRHPGRGAVLVRPGGAAQRAGRQRRGGPRGRAGRHRRHRRGGRGALPGAVPAALPHRGPGPAPVDRRGRRRPPVGSERVTAHPPGAVGVADHRHDPDLLRAGLPDQAHGDRVPGAGRLGWSPARPRITYRHQRRRGGQPGELRLRPTAAGSWRTAGAYAPAASPSTSRVRNCSAAARAGAYAARTDW